MPNSRQYHWTSLAAIIISLICLAQTVDIEAARTRRKRKDHKRDSFINTHVPARLDVEGSLGVDLSLNSNLAPAFGYGITVQQAYLPDVSILDGPLFTGLEWQRHNAKSSNNANIEYNQIGLVATRFFHSKFMGGEPFLRMRAGLNKMEFFSYNNAETRGTLQGGYSSYLGFSAGLGFKLFSKVYLRFMYVPTLNIHSDGVLFLNSIMGTMAYRL